MKRCAFFLLGLMLTVFVTGCHNDEDSPVPERTESPVNQPSVFETVDLTASYLSKNIDPRKAFARLKVNINLKPNGTDATRFYEQNRLFVRSAFIDGLRMKGSLDTNSIASGNPIWQDSNGKGELDFSGITFYDGRKDGQEGSVNGDNPDEKPQGLNPQLTENYASMDNNKFGTGKNPGISGEEQALFEFSSTCDVGDGYFYVIPRNRKTGVNLIVNYTIETIDPNIPALLSDGQTSGLSVKNSVKADNIFGADIDFEAGKSYLINIVSGDMGVKVETSISDWPN